MMSKEYCRYIRTYSELEGLQHAHTLVYCGAAAAQGVVMELRQEQDGRVRRSAVLLQDSFARAMQLLRYLCENSIGLEQWLDVLDDAGQSYELLENAGEAGTVPDFTGKNLEFCAICGVGAGKLVADYAIDTWMRRVYIISRFNQTCSFLRKNLQKVRCARCIWMNISAGWLQSWKTLI